MRARISKPSLTRVYKCSWGLTPRSRSASNPLILKRERSSAARCRSSVNTKGRPTEQICGWCVSVTMSSRLGETAAATNAAGTVFPRESDCGAASSQDTIFPSSARIATETNPASSSKVTVSEELISPNSPAAARTNAVPTFWMTGKRDFSARSKNSDVTRLVDLCWKYEGAFGEIKLACDLLHLMIGKAVRLGQHGQRIPAEARLRKHVTGVVTIFHESHARVLVIAFNDLASE